MILQEKREMSNVCKFVNWSWSCIKFISCFKRHTQDILQICWLHHDSHCFLGKFTTTLLHYHMYTSSILNSEIHKFFNHNIQLIRLRIEYTWVVKEPTIYSFSEYASLDSACQEQLGTRTRWSWWQHLLSYYQYNLELCLRFTRECLRYFSYMFMQLLI